MNLFISLLILCIAQDSQNGYVCEAPVIRESLPMFPTSDEVLSACTNLRSSKAKDITGSQIQSFKYVMDLLATVLLHVCNLSLRDDVFA